MPYLLKMERPYAALIVDDSTLVRKVLSEQLILEGVFKIAEADNGEPALEILQSSARPDIIFCDLQMPALDGLEFLRHLTALDYDGALVLMSGGDHKYRSRNPFFRLYIQTRARKFHGYTGNRLNLP